MLKDKSSCDSQKNTWLVVFVHYSLTWATTVPNLIFAQFPTISYKLMIVIWGQLDWIRKGFRSRCRCRWRCPSQMLISACFNGSDRSEQLIISCMTILVFWQIEKDSMDPQRKERKKKIQSGCWTIVEIPMVWTVQIDQDVGPQKWILSGWYNLLNILPDPTIE